MLDPFAGTFTTSAVAQRLRRRSIGIELSREYVGTGLRRLGLARELDGVELKPIEKRRKQLNRGGVRRSATARDEGLPFENA